MEPEYVYCLKNDKMPNTCKCGGTAKSPQDRCNQISNTSLPVKCELAYFIEVNDWRKAEKYVHDRIIEMGIKRFKGREWFDCNPDDIKSVFDECEKLYRYVKGGSEGDGKEGVNKNIKQDETEIEIKKYHCEICNYDTIERTAFYHHNKSKKHEICSKKINIDEYEKLRKENQELKQKLTHFENTKNKFSNDIDNEENLKTKLKEMETEYKHKLELIQKEIEYKYKIKLKEMELEYKHKLKIIKKETDELKTINKVKKIRKIKIKI